MDRLPQTRLFRSGLHLALQITANSAYGNHYGREECSPPYVQQKYDKTCTLVEAVDTLRSALISIRFQNICRWIFQRFSTGPDSLPYWCERRNLMRKSIALAVAAGIANLFVSTT